MSEIITPFVVPIHISKLTNKKLDQQLISKVYKLREQTVGRDLSNVGGWQSEIISSEDKDIKKFFTEAHDSIKNFIGYYHFQENINICSKGLWFNYNPKGSYNKSHMHTGSNMSAAYYLKVPKNSGNIVFEHPSEGLIADQSVKKFNEFNSETFTYTCNEGDLLLFPSWLKHHVEINNSEMARISLSFNLELSH
tara:strand:+ start:524 stop:1105 length:582 start_codon:yes stop_codon:yes gene_type:complete